MRVSKKMLQIKIENLNHYTSHSAKIFFTNGCGVYLIIDEKEYSQKNKKGNYTGISNRQAWEILGKYDNEVWKGYLQKKQ